MDLQLFKTFLIVAKLENISQAAERLNFTQPTITTQIQSLEQNFGVEFFERVGKKIFLTDAGRQMVKNTEKLMSLMLEIKDDMEPFRKINYLLRLGISTQMINYFLPPILEEIQKSLPEMQISIEVCKNTKEVCNKLISNYIDFGIIHGVTSNIQIQQSTIIDDEILWVCSTATFKQHNCNHSVEDYPIINFKKKGSLFREKFDVVMKDKNITSVIEYSDSEAVKRAVLNGLGVSYLPRMLVQEDMRHGKLIELLKGPKMELSISLIINKNKKRTTAINVFLGAISNFDRTCIYN